MALIEAFKKGDKVTFCPSPRSSLTVTATVIGTVSSRGLFLVTKDSDGVERRVRPGSCTKVA